MDLLQALKDIPIPVILFVLGTLVLVLGLIRIRSHQWKFEILPEKQNLALIIGGLMQVVAIGLWIYFPNQSAPKPITETKTYEWTLATPEAEWSPRYRCFLQPKIDPPYKKNKA